jgi:hypothetical protein
MSERKRSRLSATQRTEIWSRWKSGQSLHEIGRAFDKPHSCIRCLLLPRGGIPAPGNRIQGHICVPQPSAVSPELTEQQAKVLGVTLLPKRQVDVLSETASGVIEVFSAQNGVLCLDNQPLGYMISGQDSPVTPADSWTASSPHGSANPRDGNRSQDAKRTHRSNR